MATPYIVPLGFIDQTTNEGTVFFLTNPKDSLELRPDTHVTVWQYSQKNLALAKLRGRITEVGYNTAMFITVETHTDPRWPQDSPMIGENTPVYLAVENSFEPDQARMLTQDQADALQEFSIRYRALRGNISETDPKYRNTT